jgi:hypothetical protein
MDYLGDIWGLFTGTASDYADAWVDDQFPEQQENTPQTAQPMVQEQHEGTTMGQPQWVPWASNQQVILAGAAAALIGLFMVMR